MQGEREVTSISHCSRRDVKEGGRARLLSHSHIMRLRVLCWLYHLHSASICVGNNSCILVSLYSCECGSLTFLKC